MIEYAGSQRAGARARARERAEFASLARRIDWVLLCGVLGLVAYGIWAIHGIRPASVTHQAVFAVAGLVGLVATTLIDPDLYRRYRRALYAGTVGIMLIVFVAGPVTRGSRRWLQLGFFSFQPSEFGKLLLVLALAGFLSGRPKELGQWKTTFTATGLALAPILLVFLQPDLGTALVYGAALFAVLFVAGTRWLHLAALGAIVAAGALAVLWLLPAAGVHVLKSYQEQRLTSFLHPTQAPQGATYNLTQSMTALGSGGFHGRGVAGATQTRFNYLPEPSTDFVFAAFGEEQGFVGSSILLLLYLLIVWRALRVITLARDAFSAIVAGGIALALLFQIAVNAGMTMGIAPITGIPLPFVSVGGSSLLANLAAMGVLLAVHARARRRR